MIIVINENGLSMYFREEKKSFKLAFSIKKKEKRSLVNRKIPIEFEQTTENHQLTLIPNIIRQHL